MGMNLELFPPLNATLNSISFLFLTAGFCFIRFGRNPKAHRVCMGLAFLVSVAFMASYVTYHSLKAGTHTRFGVDGWIAGVYYAMLLSHILLAMVNLPLVLITLGLAIKGRYATHRKWARWTFPIWYYVSITGVLVYFFLYQWFPGERL